MDFQDIFNEYYTQYRGDSDIPGSDDDEWLIAIQLCNQAIRRWDRVDGILWNELFALLSDADDGDTTVVTGLQDYEVPSNFRKPGGWIMFLDSSGGTVKRLKCIQPYESQLYTDSSDYAYFTGDPNNGFTLHLNPAPGTSDSGLTLQYMYYKKPTTLTSAETGTTLLEMNDPNFAVQDMLANRFRNTQKWPAYQTARKDADLTLSNMVNDNAAGTNFNSFKVPDISGDSGFGS